MRTVSRKVARDIDVQAVHQAAQCVSFLSTEEIHCTFFLKSAACIVVIDYGDRVVKKGSQILRRLGYPSAIAARLPVLLALIDLCPFHHSESNHIMNTLECQGYDIFTFCPLYV